MFWQGCIYTKLGNVPTRLFHLCKINCQACYNLITRLFHLCNQLPGLPQPCYKVVDQSQGCGHLVATLWPPCVFCMGNQHRPCSLSCIEGHGFLSNLYNRVYCTIHARIYIRAIENCQSEDSAFILLRPKTQTCIKNMLIKSTGYSERPPYLRRVLHCNA